MKAKFEITGEKVRRRAGRVQAVFIINNPHFRQILYSQDGTSETPRAGKHYVVKDINLVTLMWTEGERSIFCDYRLEAKVQDSLTKNILYRVQLHHYFH